MKPKRHLRILTVLALVLATACAQTIPDRPFPERKLKRLVDPKEYDLSCSQPAGTPITNRWIKWVGGLNDKLVERANMDVSVEEQQAVGRELRGAMDTLLGPVIYDHPQAADLMNIQKLLLRARRNPSGLRYCVSVVRSDAVNALTAGGEVFVTTALLEQASSRDELAFLIAHEIAHNELGHIRAALKAEKIRVALLGEELADLALQAAEIVNMAFNQPEEAEADLMGIDMALVAGFDPCAGIAFFERLVPQEDAPDDFDNFFRTHPYSERRIICYRDHLRRFHGRACR